MKHMVCVVKPILRHNPCALYAGSNLLMQEPKIRVGAPMGPRNALEISPRFKPGLVLRTSAFAKSQKQFTLQATGSMDDATTNALLKSRCVLLRGEITEESARDCMAQLLYLGYGASTLPATLLVDSPGGHVGAAVALLRTMSELPYPLATHCLGAAGGAAAAIVAHGRHGLRTAARAARFAFAPSSADATHGYVEAEFSQCDTALLEIIAEDTRKHEEEVATLFHAEALLTAEDALKFGLIDAISGERVQLPEG